MKLSCPACGAEMKFKSSVSVFGVCSFCNSMVVRHDLNLETLGKMADLPPDMSPFQIGTRGRFEGKGFEIVGRQKIGWQDGTWNEWYALFEDGRAGWLAEAQGMLMLNFLITEKVEIPSQQNVYVGRAFPLFKDQIFEVSDIKEATCIGSEGELPLSSQQGRKSTSVDLRGPGNQFASIDYGADLARIYLGKFVEMESLSLTALREIDGW